MVSQLRGTGLAHGDLVSGCDAIKCSRLAAWGPATQEGMFEVGGPTERSFRRRGPRLVVVGALLGALIGVVLGLAVEGPETSAALAAPGRTGGAALAAHPPSSQPTASPTAGSGDRADGDGSTNSQRTEPAGRPSNGHGNAGKDGDRRHDKPNKDKPGKDK